MVEDSRKRFSDIRKDYDVVKGGQSAVRQKLEFEKMATEVRKLAISGVERMTVIQRETKVVPPTGIQGRISPKIPPMDLEEGENFYKINNGFDGDMA